MVLGDGRPLDRSRHDGLSIGGCDDAVQLAHEYRVVVASNSLRQCRSVAFDSLGRFFGRGFSLSQMSAPGIG